MASRFDTVVDRHGTNSYKWDTTPDGGDDPGLLQMWVADMDFAAPDEVLSALEQLTGHGIFGYSVPDPRLFPAYRNWMSRRYGIEVPEEWLLYSPGVLSALVVSITTLTSPGDGIILQPPVYYPFASLITKNKRKCVENPLVESGGTWRMDLAGLAKAAKSGAKALLLCSPHNPVGRVWTKNELEDLLSICREYSLLVLSDEIHSDIVFSGSTHYPVYTVAPDIPSVVFTSPTKTFNLAGAPMAWTIAPDQTIRRRLRAAQAAAYVGSVNVFSATAARAAYEEGGPWLDELLEYIAGNLALLKDGLKNILPDVKILPLEGTYLALLDFREMYNRGVDVRTDLLKSARLRLNDGATFGTGGEGFHRINLAAPRSFISEALERLETAFS